MQDIITLMEEAQRRIDEHNPYFTDKVETVLAILRSKGVVSYRRISQNGAWHTLLAATIVLAHEKDTAFALPTRRQQTLHDRGVSTTIVSFLDRAVMAGLIISQSEKYIAVGRLSLGEIIKAYLDHAKAA